MVSLRDFENYFFLKRFFFAWSEFKNCFFMIKIVSILFNIQWPRLLPFYKLLWDCTAGKKRHTFQLILIQPKVESNEHYFGMEPKETV